MSKIKSGESIYHSLFKSLSFLRLGFKSVFKLFSLVPEIKSIDSLIDKFWIVLNWKEM